MKRYGEVLSEYLAHEYHRVIPVFSRIVQQTHFGLFFPLRKMLRALAKIFLLNFFEAIILEQLLQRLGWRLEDALIESHLESMHHLVNLADVTDSSMLGKLSLLLLLAGYTVKLQLNSDCKLFVQQANKHCKGFTRIHREWANENSTFLESIRLCDLNPSVPPSPFQALVDNLLQISPAYSPQSTRIVRQKEVKPEPQLDRASIHLSMSCHSNLSVRDKDRLLKSLFLDRGSLAGSVLEEANHFQQHLEEEGFMVGEERGCSQDGSVGSVVDREPQSSLFARLCASDLLK